MTMKAGTMGILIITGILLDSTLNNGNDDGSLGNEGCVYFVMNL